MSATRILVAEDEPNMARVLKLQLERAGYEVRMAADGQEALEAILRDAPDVLVTDMCMPRMTGEQLCAEIEKRVPRRRFPIFVITSLADRDCTRWTQRMVNTEFVEKPLSARLLIARMQKLLARAAAHEGARDA